MKPPAPDDPQPAWMKPNAGDTPELADTRRFIRAIADLYPSRDYLDAAELAVNDRAREHCDELCHALRAAEAVLAHYRPGARPDLQSVVLVALSIVRASHE